MTLFRESINRDTILYINKINSLTVDALDQYRVEYGKKLKILVIVDQKKKILVENAKKYKNIKNVTVLLCTTESPVKVKKALAPYIDKLLAVSCQPENSIPTLKQVLPHVPYLNGPTEESLDWATNKIKMRRMLKAHNPSISPKFTVIVDGSQESIEQIEKNVGYPVVVKPAGLAASMLVSVCYHREELERTLKTTFRKISKIYKERLGRGQPQVLVEKLMEGSMYSIDGYVNDRGVTYWNPPVHIRTGRSIGFDDFFGYHQLTPTKLSKYKIEQANFVATESVKALGLRSTTCHVELMKIVGGWKIIELAPRMGGFRHTMYKKSFGTNHILNDILIRIPQKPIIIKKRKGFTVVFKIFSKKEGKLQKIKGLKIVRDLKSLVYVEVKKLIGDELRFAKHGGSSVVEIALFNEIRSELLADIRRMEKAIEIVVSPIHSKKSSN
jgi:biotin carboxylase